MVQICYGMWSRFHYLFDHDSQRINDPVIDAVMPRDTLIIRGHYRAHIHEISRKRALRARVRESWVRGLTREGRCIQI